MGLYLNPGNDAFQIAINDDIYEDKTAMIAFTNSKLNKNKRYLCVSRPRRFGKSMTAEMLAAYYSRGCDSYELFHHLKIAKDDSFAKHLNQHDVIYLNIQQFIFDSSKLDSFIECMESEVIKELKETYGNLFTENTLGLPNVLAQIYQNNPSKNKGFIFILDEWDCIFREAKNDQNVQKQYLDFLKLLFKDRAYVCLAYMTGILPIKKYGTHSAINIFDEYSMMNPRELSEYVGFTEDEVKELCARYHRDFDEVQNWYDGYKFAGHWNIYNPKSVVDVMQSGEFDSYWTETETYEALKIYIETDYDGLRESVITMLGGGRCAINSRKFQNDMTTFRTKDDVLTLLVHLGYLAYDKKTQEVYIPNKEIASEFMNAMDEPAWDGVIQAIAQSKTLLDATLTLDADTVAALLIELKWSKSAETAIRQIKDKEYVETLKNYTGDILLVGINYDKKSKEHQCIIERYKV